jgi:hypothetical protein
MQWSYIASATGVKPIVRDEEAAMVQLNPQFVTRDGKKEYVILTYEDFLRLQEVLEDAEDLLALREAKEEDAGQPTISMAEMKKRLGMTD